MKLREMDDIKNQKYRLNETVKHLLHSSPIIATIIIVCIITVSFIYTYTLGMNVDAYGIGDPYHCEECKRLGIACSEHKNFDAKEGLREKIHLLSSFYILDSNEDYVKRIMYNGNVYDTDCDFCCENKSECYGCRYDREALTAAIVEIENTYEFKSKLCDKCSDLRYANCSYCRSFLEDQLIKQFNLDETR